MITLKQFNQLEPQNKLWIKERGIFGDSVRPFLEADMYKKIGEEKEIEKEITYGLNS